MRVCLCSGVRYGEKYGCMYTFRQSFYVHCIWRVDEYMESGHGFVGLGKRCSCGVILPVLSMYFVPYALITAEEVLVMDLEQGHVSWIEVTWCPGLSSHQAKGCILQALEMV